ncbi:MAG: type II secretion system protein M [Gammaproteobacteria bacterium]|nr:type II secretion system protein M [Gammaproteobacteria bacterium]MDH4314763.1 type II secretion system protein M [Gammaproteobacteria bacterium]MDH5214665.1 type II secretion system protein M [Gammaproteobacteria bacterium]
MKSWLETLQPRERMLVLSAAGMIAFAILYFGLWQPVNRSHTSLRNSVQTWSNALADLRPLRGQVQSVSAMPRVGQNESLVVIIDNTLRQRGLYSALQRSQPTSQNGIRVEFENAAFDDLVLWLGDLGQSYGMHVQSGSFSGNASGTPGRVNATVTLER